MAHHSAQYGSLPDTLNGSLQSSLDKTECRVHSLEDSHIYGSLQGSQFNSIIAQSRDQRLSPCSTASRFTCVGQSDVDKWLYFILFIYLFCLRTYFNMNTYELRDAKVDMFGMINWSNPDDSKWVTNSSPSASHFNECWVAACGRALAIETWRKQPTFAFPRSRRGNEQLYCEQTPKIFVIYIRPPKQKPGPATDRSNARPGGESRFQPNPTWHRNKRSSLMIHIVVWPRCYFTIAPDRCGRMVSSGGRAVSDLFLYIKSFTSPSSNIKYYLVVFSK